MHVTDIADKINDKIKLIEQLRTELETKGREKAQSIMEYEKAIAVTMIRLKNGEQLNIDNRAICKPVASITEKIARGICWREKLRSEQAECSYKATITSIQAVQAELNALQSIYRHLEVT